MARTRAATGNSKPRVVDKVEAVVAPKKRASTAAGKKSTANTSKPRSKVASGRVEKKSAAPSKTTKTAKSTGTKKAAPKAKGKTVDKKIAKAAAKHETEVTDAKAKQHHEPTLLDTITGAALKVQGIITGSSGKKAAGTARIRGTDGKKPAKK